MTAEFATRTFNFPGGAEVRRGWHGVLPRGIRDSNGRSNIIRAFGAKRSEDDAISECEAWLLAAHRLTTSSGGTSPRSSFGSSVQIHRCGQDGTAPGWAGARPQAAGTCAAREHRQQSGSRGVSAARRSIYKRSESEVERRSTGLSVWQARAEHESSEFGVERQPTSVVAIW